MSILRSIRSRGEAAVRSALSKSVRNLPVVTDQLIATPARERAAAKAGLVPRRCGLCRHFSREAFEQILQVNPTFTEAMKFARPALMSGRKGSPPKHVSEMALELRPGLTEEWKDYGVCTRHPEPDGTHTAIWGFWEQPPMVPEPSSSAESDAVVFTRCEDWK